MRGEREEVRGERCLGGVSAVLAFSAALRETLRGLRGLGARIPGAGERRRGKTQRRRKPRGATRRFAQDAVPGRGTPNPHGRKGAFGFRRDSAFSYLPFPSGSGSPPSNGAVEATMRTKREMSGRAAWASRPPRQVISKVLLERYAPIGAHGGIHGVHGIP